MAFMAVFADIAIIFFFNNSEAFSSLLSSDRPVDFKMHFQALLGNKEYSKTQIAKSPPEVMTPDWVRQRGFRSPVLFSSASGTADELDIQLPENANNIDALCSTCGLDLEVLHSHYSAAPSSGWKGTLNI